MKQIFLILTLVIVTVVVVEGQTVQTSQEFLNSANKSFEEVVLLRTALAAQQKAIQALEEQSVLQQKLITSEKALNESLSREIKVKDEQLVIYKKMNCSVSTFLFIFKKKRCL